MVLACNKLYWSCFDVALHFSCVVFKRILFSGLFSIGLFDFNNCMDAFLYVPEVLCSGSWPVVLRIINAKETNNTAAYL